MITREDIENVVAEGGTSMPFLERFALKLLEERDEALAKLETANKYPPALSLLDKAEKERDAAIEAKKAAELRAEVVIEEAAKICEDNDEVTNLRASSRRIEKKTSNNVNGLAYAAAIRELKQRVMKESAEYEGKERP